MGDAGGLIKVGEYNEGDIAKILGRGGIGGRIGSFFGKVFRFLHAKPVQYGLLGVAIGAPIVGSLISGSTGGTQQQTSPSSPLPQQTYHSSPPIGGGGTPHSSQSADVLNPYSPQAQYYSALAQTAQTQPTTTQSTTSSTTTSSKASSIFSNPLFWVGIAVFVIIVILLVVR